MAILKASFAAFLLLVAADAVQGMKGSLHDNNFEHTTQASTGQTTGIWAVLFCSSKRCLVHSHEWAKAVDQGLNEQIFFVKVNTDSNPQLSHRFAPLEKIGTLILLREGQMYRTQAPLSAEELVSWASKGYLSSPALPVPEPVSAYDLFVASLIEHKWTVLLTGGVLAAFSILFALPGGRNAKAAAAKKKKSPKSQ